MNHWLLKGLLKKQAAQQAPFFRNWILANLASSWIAVDRIVQDCRAAFENAGYVFVYGLYDEIDLVINLLISDGRIERKTTVLGFMTTSYLRQI